MPTQILAEAATAANSSPDTVVVAGTPKTLGLFRAGELKIELNERAFITRKDAAGEYQPTGLMLSSTQHDIVIIAPGTYRVERPEVEDGFGVIED